MRTTPQTTLTYKAASFSIMLCLTLASCGQTNVPSAQAPGTSDKASSTQSSGIKPQSVDQQGVEQPYAVTQLSDGLLLDVRNDQIELFVEQINLGANGIESGCLDYAESLATIVNSARSELNAEPVVISDATKASCAALGESRRSAAVDVIAEISSVTESCIGQGIQIQTDISGLQISAIRCEPVAP